MQVVINKCFSLKPWKKFVAESSCRFWEKRKNRTFNKWRHRAEG